MQTQFPETWHVSKPAAVSDSGIVASQHHEASEVGAEVLRNGGNAVDAAIATGLAIGVLEPWMSGPGGCGYMVVHDAEIGRTHAIEFGVRAPASLDVTDYPLDTASATDDDLFGWPRVVDDRNVRGPLAIAVPSLVAGHSTALERFGTMSWSDVMAPAIRMAQRGIRVDWHTTLRIALEARGLAEYPASRDFFLPHGLPAASPEPDSLITLRSEQQVATLERLRDAGPDDFYKGDIAHQLVADLQDAGSRMTAADLANYEPRVIEAVEGRYRDTSVFVAPNLNAGPTLLDALARLESAWEGHAGAPDSAAYVAYSQSLFDAYRHRLTTMGEGNTGGSTTHISVVDKKGNMVALTQTLLSVFGSRVLLPGVGFLMNNGIMWFDPRPGGPNAMAPGRKPLTNMCPAIVRRASGDRIALGASGGRRIFPAIFQLVSFLSDYGMSLEDAFHTPRIDVSGGELVSVDARLAEDVHQALSKRWSIGSLSPSVISPFACPNAVHHGNDSQYGCAFINSPWSAAVAA